MKRKGWKKPQCQKGKLLERHRLILLGVETDTISRTSIRSVKSSSKNAKTFSLHTCGRGGLQINFFNPARISAFKKKKFRTSLGCCWLSAPRAVSIPSEKRTRETFITFWLAYTKKKRLGSYFSTYA